MPKVGGPDLFLDIIKLLHTNTTAMVTTNRANTENFPVKTDAKPGCVLAPTSFVVYRTFVFHRAQHSSLEIQYRYDGGGLFNLGGLKAVTKVTKNKVVKGLTSFAHLKKMVMQDSSHV